MSGIYDRNNGVISEADRQDLETVESANLIIYTEEETELLTPRQLKEARWFGLIEPEITDEQAELIEQANYLLGITDEQYYTDFSGSL